MRKITIIIIINSFLYSCNSENNKSVHDKAGTFIDTIVVKVERPNFIEKNFTDKNGKKQGTWITYDKKGFIYKIENFINDTLNGIVIEYCWTDRKTWNETSYYKGKKHGYKSTIQIKEFAEAQFLSYYENDSCKWLMFPTNDMNYIGSVGQLTKGIDLSVDSFYVKAPFKNGNLWYEGAFIKDKNGEPFAKKEKPIGTHKRYFENGKIRMITKYSPHLPSKLLEFIEFNEKGDTIKFLTY